jgi:hypothetical protein
MYLKLEMGDTTNLCEYFWSTLGNVLKLFLFIAIGLFMLTMASMLVFASVNFIVFVVTGILDVPLAWVNMELAIGTYWFCTLVAVTGGSIAWCLGDVNVLPNYLKPRQDTKEVKPSLFKEYYKSWKAKVCPLVELER